MQHGFSSSGVVKIAFRIAPSAFPVPLRKFLSNMKLSINRRSGPNFVHHGNALKSANAPRECAIGAC
jgi:hypothetical protein